MSRKEELRRYMQTLKIDPNTFTDEELRLFEQGGVVMSDSDMDSEGMRGSVSLSDVESQSNPLNPTRTQPKFPRQQQYQQQPEPVEVRNNYQSIINMLEKQNSFLTAEVKRVAAAGEAEKQRIMSNNRIEVDRLLSEVRALKTKLAYQDAQMPGIRDALQQVRDMLSGLVPEQVYLKLRDLNQNDLPLQEWLLVQVWEVVYPYKKEGDFQRREIAALREEIKQMGEKQQSMVVEMEHQLRMTGDKEEDMKRHKISYDNARKSIELELQKALEELTLLREKGARFDELNRDFKRLEQEKFLLEEKMGFYDTKKNQDGRSMAGEIYKVQDELKRKTDLLQQDKEYLTRENIGLLEKVKRYEDKIDKLDKEYLEAKNQAQEYLFQLLNAKNESSSESEKRIYKQLEDLKEKHQGEIEQAKKNLIEIYEKQILFLREAKEEVEMKKDNGEAQLKEKQYAYDQLLIEFRTLQRRVDADLSEMRIQLRLKSEESERVQGLYEENLANLKATKHENEMLREKINVLRSEYYKMQVDSKDEMTSVRAQLEVAKEQLANYEGIEHEIDEAIMKSAVNDYDGANPLLTVMGSVPTTSKRRIQQAINLAQRLQAKQRECESLYRQLRERDQEIEKLKDEININRDVIDKMNQPHSYLVQHIEEKDREIIKYKQALKKTDQDYSYLKAEYDDLKQRYERAEQDVERLKVKRQNIQNIQNILLGIATGNQGDMRQNLRQAINDISEALNTKSYVDPQRMPPQYGQQTPPQKPQPDWASKLKKGRK